MSFRVNFFPIPYILVLILLITFVTVFNETIYTYLSSNFQINGAIVVLFIFCNIWVLGSLAYFNRSAKLISKLFANVGPAVEKQSIKKNGEKDEKKSMVLQSSYSIAGTLFDSPVFSSVLAKLDRKNKLEVSRADADEIAQTMIDNAARLLAPSKFIASIFVLSGLIGTFLGLLETIGGVARALNTLATGGISTDIGKFIKLLSDPLQGMSTAFSASLFGLTSALISNFANHTAWQKVLLFTAKVRNYLISNTGVFDEDPARISVRDLLISLEESFDTLYRGITNKLEDLTNHIATMGSVIVKTHERQERMLRVILKDHELMEQFWNKFLLGDQGIMGLVDEIAGRLSVVLPESMRKVFAPVLENMLDIMDNNAAMLDRAVRLAEDSVNVQSDIADINGEISGILNQNTDILSRVNNELITVNNRLNLDELASLIAEGNGIKQSIAGLINKSNNILNESNELSKDANAINIECNNLTIEGNNLANALIASVDNNTGAVEEVIGALGETNAIVVDIKSINEQANILAQQDVALTQEVINNQAAANNLSQSILYAANSANTIGGDTLLLLGNMLEENNQIARTTLSGVVEIAQHNANIVRVLDERFGMIIAFSSDLLATANATLGTIDTLGNSLASYYQQLSLDLRLDGINESINNVASIVASELPIMDASVGAANAIIQRLDNNNEITLGKLGVANDLLSSSNAIAQRLDNANEISLKKLNIVNDILNNAAITNNTLGDIYVTTSKYFSDTANFSSLYVGMERQINALLASFLEFKERFNVFLNDSAVNSQTLSNINVLHANMAERIQSIGSLLNDIAVSLGGLSGISAEHKDLTMSIRDGINNILGQNDSLNNGVVTLGNIFNDGITRVVGGIGSISEISVNYSQAMNGLLESIVANLASLADINTKMSEVIDVNGQSMVGIQQISKQLDEQNKDNKNHAAISEEVKNILINTDGNVTGIGNVLSNVKATGDTVVKRLDSVVNFNSSAAEHNKSVKDANDKMEKVLDQIAILINNLGVVYEKYGDKVKEGLDEVIKGISSVFQVNGDMSKVLDEISVLTASIEQDAYGRANHDELLDLKEKFNTLISLKESVLNEFERTLNPTLDDFGTKFAVVVEKLSNLSETAETNKEILAKINTDTDKKLVEHLGVINTSIDGLGKQFKDLNGYLNSVGAMFGEQRAAINSINDGLKDLNSLTKDFKSIPKTLSDSAAAIINMGNVIRSLDEKSGSRSADFAKTSERLSEEIKSLAGVVKQLDGNFKNEFAKVGASSSELYNNISRLVQEVSALGGDLRNGQNISNANNEALGREIGQVLVNISSNIEDIKSTIANTVSSQLMGELTRISGNQQEIARKIEHIIPYIDELVRVVGNIGSANMSDDLARAINALEEIKDTDINNNDKLDLLVRATDTLVSEMLNSRGVSQAILDIIAELGGFRKVR